MNCECIEQYVSYIVSPYPVLSLAIKHWFSFIPHQLMSLKFSESVNLVHLFALLLHFGPCIYFNTMKLEGRGKGSLISGTMCVITPFSVSCKRQVRLVGIPHAPHVCGRQCPVVQPIRFIDPGLVEIYIDFCFEATVVFVFVSPMLAI